MVGEEDEVDQNNTQKGKEIKFHVRTTDVAAKDASACRGLGMLETSKLIVESLKLQPSMAADILEAINIPEKYQGTIATNCRRKQRQLPREITCSDISPYRSVDGTCNNLERPFQGAAMMPYKRYLRPDYEDGVDSIRGFRRTGPNVLPNPRQVSDVITRAQEPLQLPSFTQMVKTWGQFLDHDITSTAVGVAPTVDNDGFPRKLSCCSNGVSTRSPFPDCHPIDVTRSTFYRSVGVRCLTFIRSLPADNGFSLRNREQLNQVTSFIDGSMIYGSTPSVNRRMRSIRGKLRENSRGEDGSCSSTRCKFAFLPERRSGSFLSGDTRVNEQPSLTAMHTIWLRYHNLLVKELRAIHEDMEENVLYEEVRRIIGALIQHITYSEFLPILLGQSTMNEVKLNPVSGGEVHRYDRSISADIANVFPTVVFRVGHTHVADRIRGGTRSVSLSNAFNNARLTKTSNMSPSNLLNGECSTPLEASDVFIVDSLRNHLFARGPDFNSGMDLLSLNIMRGRDHGIPGYNHWRKFCNKVPYTTFDEMSDEMSPEIIRAFRKLYRAPDDIDLYIAGLAEIPVGDGILGSTFTCLMAKAFSDLKFSDRFWYENKEQPHPFTDEQINAIKSTTLASVLCDVTLIKRVQPLVMMKSEAGNEQVPCDTIRQHSIRKALREFWK